MEAPKEEPSSRLSDQGQSTDFRPTTVHSQEFFSNHDDTSNLSTLFVDVHVTAETMSDPYLSIDLSILVNAQKRYGYIKNHKKTVKNGQARARESEENKKKPKNQSRSQKSQAPVNMVNNSNPLQDKTS
ncbi:hypothetical protein Tco_0671302 [Tanacetum coccineum]